MESSTKTTVGQMAIIVSDDRLQAWIELPGVGSPQFSRPDEAAIVSALAANEIELTDATHERVREYLRIIEGTGQGDPADGPPEIPERFLISEGQAAVEARDGEFERDEALEKQAGEWEADAPVNYYTRNSIVTIEADANVGRLLPPADGSAGTDVLGQEVVPQRMKGMPLMLGHGLRTAEGDPSQVVAEVPGRFAREGNTIFMRELLQIPSNVDFESGNIDSVIDVHVFGCVKPNFSVRTAKSLAVNRTVESARLEAEGDIQIRGGVFGQGSGQLVRAGGSIAASICDAAELKAGGDICIVKEIINSNLNAEGELRIEHGSIIGGEIYARNGVNVKNAGSDAGARTRIAVGIDGAVLYRAQQMDKQVRKHQEQAEQIRTRIQPLLSNLKRLTPAQREQATELMAKADEIEFSADDLVVQRDQMLDQAKPDGKPGVDVEGTLYPGVVLVFGLRETAIKTPVKGPARVEERLVKGATEIAVVNQLTASVIALPSATVDLERFKKLEQESGEPDGDEQEQHDDGA